MASAKVGPSAYYPCDLRQVTSPHLCKGASDSACRGEGWTWPRECLAQSKCSVNVLLKLILFYYYHCVSKCVHMCVRQ